MKVGSVSAYPPDGRKEPAYPAGNAPVPIAPLFNPASFLKVERYFGRGTEVQRGKWLSVQKDHLFIRLRGGEPGISKIYRKGGVKWKKGRSLQRGRKGVEKY